MAALVAAAACWFRFPLLVELPTSGVWPDPAGRAYARPERRLPPPRLLPVHGRPPRHRAGAPLSGRRPAHRAPARSRPPGLHHHRRLHGLRGSRRRPDRCRLHVPAVPARGSGPCCGCSARGRGISPRPPVSPWCSSSSWTPRSGSAVGPDRRAAARRRRAMRSPETAPGSGPAPRRSARPGGTRRGPRRLRAPGSASSARWPPWATWPRPSATSPTGRPSPTRPGCRARSSASAWPSSGWRRSGRCPCPAWPTGSGGRTDAPRHRVPSAWPSPSRPRPAPATGGSSPSSPWAGRCSAPPTPLAQVAAAEETASHDRAKAVALVAAGYGVGAGLTAIIHGLAVGRSGSGASSPWPSCRWPSCRSSAAGSTSPTVHRRAAGAGAPGPGARGRGPAPSGAGCSW